MDLPDFAKAKLKEISDEMPDKIKHTTSLRRLLNLAKQSPFAAASEDFLELWEMRVKELETQIEMFKGVVEMIKTAKDEGDK